MNNIYKHAKASEIFFLLRITKKYIILSLNDNGVGFNIKTVTKGIGLQNISLRADSLRAKYKFISMEEKGTRFIFVVRNGKNKIGDFRR
jgi:signal transduction histidine kinase